MRANLLLVMMGHWGRPEFHGREGAVQAHAVGTAVVQTPLEQAPQVAQGPVPEVLRWAPSLRADGRSAIRQRSGIHCQAMYATAPVTITMVSKVCIRVR